MKGALAVIVALALASQAAAQGPGVRDAEVRAAIRDYDGLDYGSVIPRLVKSLSRADLTEHDRRAALAYLARSYAIFKRNAEAESTFDELLQRDPAFAPADSESPRIREAYLAAKARRAVNTPLPPQLVAKPESPTTVAALAEPAPPATNTKWLLIGGGVVVVAAVTVLLIVRPWQDDASGTGRAVPDSQLGRFDLP